MSLTLTFSLRSLKTRLDKVQERLITLLDTENDILGISVEFFADPEGINLQPNFHLWHQTDMLDRDNLFRLPPRYREKVAALGGWLFNDHLIENLGTAALRPLGVNAKRQVWELVLVREGGLFFHTNLPPLLGESLSNAHAFKTHHRDTCIALYDGQASAHQQMEDIIALQHAAHDIIKARHDMLARALGNSDMNRPHPDFTVSLEKTPT